MARWAQSVCDRRQVVLFSPTLDASIAADHPVRLFDEVLRSLDFSQWEREYVQTEGQPPIHPRVMAGVLLYGMSVGIRSSRKLEEATGNRLDFMWLCECRAIDHTTLAKFRVKFEKPLKDLFGQIGKVAIGMGMANLNQIALDGTVKRANNSRQARATKSSLTEKLAALDQQINQLMEESRRTDQKEDELFGSTSPYKLPAQLRNIESRQKRLREALKKLEAEAKQPKTPACPPEPKPQAQAAATQTPAKDREPSVPTTDPDSRILQNKTGGYAPNYLLVLATEGQNGLIIDAQLVHDEPGSVLETVRNVQENFDQKPAQLLADSGFNTGENLQGLVDQNIQPLMPPRQRAQDPNPAVRPDPSLPVPPSQLDQLPTRPQRHMLDKSAFIYEASEDQYRCPMGRKLVFIGTNAYQRDRVKGHYRVYESNPSDCSACPLAGRCLSNRQQTRRLVRDEYQPLRDQMAERMKSQEGTSRYRRRNFLCETPFGVFNTTMNLGQWLLRGIRKVQMELTWACCAYNLKKMARLLSQAKMTQQLSTA
jgi:transposase